MASRPVHDDDGETVEGALAASVADPLRFAEVYDQRFALVVAFFAGRVRCPHAAADLTAETFARAFQVRRRFDPERGSASAWLLGIAANLHRQWCRTGAVGDRARLRLGIHAPVLVEDDLEGIERLVDLAEVRAALRGALEELAPGQRDAVVLRIGWDLSHAEVARRLGCSVGASRVRVSRGLDALSAHVPRPET